MEAEKKGYQETLDDYKGRIKVSSTWHVTNDKN